MEVGDAVGVVVGLRSRFSYLVEINRETHSSISVFITFNFNTL